MHERSLVKTLIDQVLEECRRRGLGRIHEIHLQIGEFSGVEPLLVESAFASMSPEYWDSAVRLVIEVMPLTAACRICGAAFHVQGFRFVCPQCGGGDIQITAGEEMQLASIRAEQSICEGVKT